MNSIPLNQPQYLRDDAWVAEARQATRRWRPAIPVWPEVEAPVADQAARLCG